MTIPKHLSRHPISAALLALLATLLFASAAGARPDIVSDRSFGQDGLVTEPLGPAELSSIVGSKTLLRDHRGRIVVGAANDNGWQVRRYFPSGRPDLSFGDDGKVVIKAWGGIDWEFIRANLTSAALRPDGRILLVGFVRNVSGNRDGDSYMVFKQLMPNGSPDVTFGQANGGSVFGNQSGAAAVSLRPDGRILVGGFRELRSTGPADDGVLIGLTEDGRRDPNFAGGKSIVIPSDGRKSSYLLDVKVLRNGNILAAGAKANRFLVIKLRKDGSYVRSFGKNGRAVFGPGGKKCRCSLGRGMAIDSRGRIVVTGVVRPPELEEAGYSATVRFRRGGRLDRSFARKGVARFYATKRTGRRTTNLYDNAIDSRGGIWATGSAGPELEGNRRAVTVRYLPDGTKDRSFFDKGKLLTRLGEASVGRQVRRVGNRVYLFGRYDRGTEERTFLRRFLPRKRPSR